MRTRLGVVGLALGVALGGCGSTKSGGGGAPAGSFTVTFGPISVPPGVENTQCVVVPLGNPNAIHVGQIHNVLGNASHHMIVYAVNDATEQLTPFDCQPFTDTLDPTKGSVLMVTQKKDDILSLPQGVGYTLQANQMIRLEMHYINPGSSAVTLQSSSTMIPIPDAQYENEAGFLFIGDPDIILPPNATTTLGPVFFPVPSEFAGAQFFAITGHEHQYGTDVLVDTSTGKTDPGTPVYDVPGWLWSEPATVTPNPPFSLPPGGGFQFSCTWNNTSSSTIRFGESATDEMCFFWAYYYPSVGSHVCIHSESQGERDFCCPGSSFCTFFGQSGGDAGPACNSVTNGATTVSINNVPAAVPAPMGGTLVDGTYYLTQASVYTGAGGASGSTGATLQASTVLSGGTYQYVQNQNGKGDSATSGTYTTSGTSITVEQTCPLPSAVPYSGYTATSTSFTLYGTIGGNSGSLTYTKQ